MRRYGDAGMRWGTLERVPHTPQNFSRTKYYWWEPTFAPGSSLRLRSCMAALAIPAAVVPEGGLPCWSLAAPAFSLPSCPHPPDPLPPRGRGRSKVYFAGGSAPGTPGIKPPAALTDLAKQVPGVGLYPLRGGAGVAFRYPAGAWQLRRGSGEQCRQPRRGGTGGEELRRLRWSSPPGQG